MNRSSERATLAAVAVPRRDLWLMFAAAAGVPISLLWDFSWESTVGIDRFWGPPHTMTYVSVGLAAMVALGLAWRGQGARESAVRLGKFHAPFGAWLVLWGTAAFVTSLIFDRWWQSAYGLGAGIWHPPQLLKATAFFVLIAGTWLLCARAQNRSEGAEIPDAILFSVAGGLALTLIAIVTLPSSYPNRQHSASFYKLGCATYPFVLAALARAGRLRWPATAASLLYTGIFCAAVWVLPLIPGKPQVGPIYNPLDHLMPPPFPLLLVVPAVATDLLMKRIRWKARPGVDTLQACALGVAFFLSFVLTQWIFAGFLLQPASDHWFFAGGGRHWPFFLKINPAGRVAFWETPADVLDGANTLVALGFSLAAAQLGLWAGAWMERVRR